MQRINTAAAARVAARGTKTSGRGIIDRRKHSHSTQFQLANRTVHKLNPRIVNFLDLFLATFVAFIVATLLLNIRLDLNLFFMKLVRNFQ